MSKEIQIIGKTHEIDDNHSRYIRGLEIKEWIRENDFKGKFAIIDDDNDMADLKDFLVKCNTFYGFGVIEMEKTLKKIR